MHRRDRDAKKCVVDCARFELKLLGESLRVCGLGVYGLGLRVQSLSKYHSYSTSAIDVDV